MRFRKTFSVLFALLVMFFSGFLLSHRSGNSRVLLDRSVLTLAAVTTRTNAFAAGIRLERILGDWIQVSGISIGNFRLRRPRKFTIGAIHDPGPVTAWFRWQDDKERKASFSSSVKDGRFFVANEKGRHLEIETGPVVLSTRDAVYFAAPLRAFPRDGREIILRFLPSANGEQDLEPFDFEIPNPMRAVAEDWVAANMPVTNRIGNAELILMDVEYSVDDVLNGIATGSAETKFRLQSSNGLDPGWEVVECRVEDCEGNRRSWKGIRRRTDLEPFCILFPYALESGRTWKVEALLVPLDNYSENERVRLRINADADKAPNGQPV